MAFQKISEVAPQTSLDIVFGPLSEMLGNHCAKLCWSVLCDYAIAASFAYFSKVRISHIFPRKLAFSTAIFCYFNIICVSILINIQCMRIVHNVWSTYSLVVIRKIPPNCLQLPAYKPNSVVRARVVGAGQRHSIEYIKGEGSPYSIIERRVPELITVLGSQRSACRWRES